jgi:hypothetical protein
MWNFNEDPPRFYPNYTFREEEEPLAFQVWKSDESSGLIHEACAETPGDREFPLFADDLQELADLAQAPVYCETCDSLIHEASDLRSRVAETRQEALTGTIRYRRGVKV